VVRTFDHIPLEDRAVPLVLPWPLPGTPGGFIEITKPDDWRALVCGLDVDPRIPAPVRAKFGRAQTLYLLGWLDPGLIKAAELAALVALELAVSDRYGAAIPRNRRSYATLLKHMVECDGLTDGQIPMVVRCGGTAIGQLTGDTRPTLAERRNALAHGDPFDGLPTAGLLELVRDLIDFAYRHHIAEAGRSPIPAVGR
jgi:hypothetical protein